MNLTLLSWAGATCLALASPTFCQSALAELHDATIPLDGQRASAIATGDFDRNGQVDLIVAGQSATALLPAVCLMNYQGQLREETFRIPGTAAASAFAVGDIDGDGDLDVLVGVNRGKDSLWRNDGSGRFTDDTPGNLDIDGGATGDVVLADLDGDGDLDVLIGSQWTVGAFSRIGLNDGTGRFRDAPNPRLPDYASHITPGDYDRDGDIDLFFAARATTGNARVLRLLLNQGNATFVDAAANLPAAPTWWTRVRAVDVDGDLDLDLAIATPSVGNTGGGLHLWINRGAATFADETAQRLPPSSGNNTELVPIDLDADGDVDFVVPSAPMPGFLGDGADLVLVNDGQGTFADRTALLGWEDAVQTLPAAAVLDLEADGDLDLVFGGSERLVAYANLGDGRFLPLNPRSFPADIASSYATVAGDLDRDGDIDLVQLAGWSDRLLLGDGFGRWHDSTVGRLPERRREGSALALADLDGDGDLDLLTGDVALYLNDGTARFTDASAGRLPLQDAFIVRAFAVADFDGDGDLDVVIAKQHGPNLFWENDGTGRFTDATAVRFGTQSPDSTWSVASGDLDGDGDLDLVFGHYDPAVKTGGFAQVWRNLGGGRFGVDAAALPVLHRNTTSVVLADFDRDGDLDLFQAALAWCHNPPPDDSRLYFNDGTGRFTDVTATHIGSIAEETQGAVAVDIDGDGDLDLLLGNALALLGCGGFNPQDTLWENDGSGRFRDATTLFLPTETRFAEHVLASDLDGDGDQDVFVTNGSHGSGGAEFAPDSLLFNLRQHLDTPNGARTRGSYDIDIYGHRPAAPPGLFAVVLIGFAPTYLPLGSLGVLRVDPAAAVLAPPIGIPTLGARRLSLSLPHQPSLLGVSLYAQALVVDTFAPVSTWRLTPATRDPIR